MLSKDKIDGIEVIPDNSYFGHFFVKLRGPKDTPYDGGIFDIEAGPRVPGRAERQVDARTANSLSAALDTGADGKPRSRRLP